MLFKLGNQPGAQPLDRATSQTEKENIRSQCPYKSSISTFPDGRLDEGAISHKMDEETMSNGSKRKTMESYRSGKTCKSINWHPWVFTRTPRVENKMMKILCVFVKGK